jgi:hypothetical protein
MLMKKLTLLAILSFGTFGCGDSGPTAPDPRPMLTNVRFLSLAEFDGYIADVRTTIPEFTTMIAEFASIASSFNAGFVPEYWIGEFTKNLLLRVEAVRARAEQIRPQNPELLKLHLEEYEASLSQFHTAFSLFTQGLEQPGSVAIDDVNDAIVAGNTHLIRLQILLGDLGGTRIDLFEDQGGGGNQDDGLDDIPF